MKSQETKVFIVDDEPLLTEMLSDYLQDQTEADSFNIQSFATGEACINSLEDNPDIIVLDYYLNSKERDAANGLDILKAIKDKSKSLPVIMLSSQKSYATAAQTIQNGAVHYVLKGKNAFQEIYEIIKANI